MPRKTVKKPTKKTVKTTKTPKKSPVKKAPAKKRTPKVEAPVQVVQAAPVQAAPVMPPTKTEAEKIWDEIKDRPIEMFALPAQTVKDHCTPFAAVPDKLFLTIRSTATLPSLEVSCGKDFVVELADKYVIVSRVVAPPVLPPTFPRR